MAAENSLLFISNNSCERHLLKSFIDLCKHTIWVVDIFSESLGTLVTETQIFVHVLVLVISSKKHDLLWILQLKSEKEADDFETILALVNIVTQE
jgi:hypothetical protein